ncbi:LysR family transcriptional regulator [Jatrophihabitans fulvus]
MDTTALATIRVVAEQGSFTAAASVLGYTQSAVSRQVAAAEHELGTVLFDRVRGGVRLTRSGSTVLRHVVEALDALDAARREATSTAPARRRVRLGAFASAGAMLLPRAVAVMRSSAPDVELVTREGTSPSLVRAVRSGSIDVALVTSRPPHRSPDQESPPLVVHTLFDSELALAVPSASGWARSATVEAATAADAPWIASPSTGDEPQLGVWPGLPGRPRVRHTARDWATKLALVASGAGVTSVPRELLPHLPDGVTVVRIDGVPAERRRVSLVHRRDASRSDVATVRRAFTEVAASLT